MRKQDFLHGSVILIISALIAKVIGAFFKIPLTNIIGGIGMSYFSGAYGLFLPIYAVFVTGLSAASAKLTAENTVIYGIKGAKKVKKYALINFSLIGIAGTLLLIACSWPFSKYVIGDKNVFISMLIISPSVFFSCITAAYRGYFEGLRNMYPTALSQVAEGAAKLIAGLVMCSYVLSNEEFFMNKFAGICDDRYALAAAGAVAGVTLSSFAGMLYMILSDFFLKDPASDKGYLPESKMKSGHEFTRSLIKIIIPIAAGALITNLTSLVDLATIIRYTGRSIKNNYDYYIMRYGFIRDIGADNFASFLYGSFNGLAVTVFNLVPSVTNMFGKSILPSFTEAWTKKNHNELQKNAEAVLSVTGMISIPAALGILVLSKEILLFLFPSAVNEAEAAYQGLAFLAPGIALLSLSFPVFSMLQATGREDLPAKITAVGAAVKLAGNMIFINIKELNAAGAGIATTLCYGVIFFISMYKLAKHTGVSINYLRIFIKPLFAGVLCMASARLANDLMSGYLSQPVTLVCAIATGATVYAVSVYCLKKTQDNGKKVTCFTL
ncbi:MAG: polysaccharide biosynthesis C-terminal domain-containing protein [Oscillospiraceae bacterium]|nr:polysaccharide biosynthesis C-terminal domain-containing protein [Oscillospiraceae bacterium]